MCLYLRQLNISLIIILLLLNIILAAITFISLVLFLKNQDKYEEDYPYLEINWIILIISIVVSIISSICVYYFGMRSVYFKMKSYFNLYFASLITYSIFSLLLILLNGIFAKKTEIKEFKQYEELIQGIFIVNIILFCIYIITLISWSFYKKKLQIQFDEAPLNNIFDPESLSDELYANIIEQSKNPDDQSLKVRYRKLSSKKHIQGEEKTTINSDSVY